MKLLVITIAAAAMLAGGANAQNSPGGTQPQSNEKPAMVGPSTTGAAPTAPAQVEPKAPGAIGTSPMGAAGGKVPNTVNPDRVPPTSPGGQGVQNN
jgi:hypothetical protein